MVQAMANALTAASAVSVVIISLLTCIEGSSQYPSYYQQNNQHLIGLVCSPPFGYLRNVCGPEVLIEEISIFAPLYLYGPNTCRITQRFLTNELEYKYQDYCWYAYKHYWNQYVYQCQVACLPTQSCTTMNQTIERSTFECCRGFEVRPPDDKSHYEYLYQTYYTPVDTTPVGCPRAVGDTVLECLSILNLTEFISFVEQSDFFLIFNGSLSDLEFTVFAPTNAAIEAVRDELETVDPNMFVGNHLVSGTVKESDLIFNQQFETFANTTIHSTTVVYADRSLYQYNSQYAKNNHPSSLIRYTSVGFINGARVVNNDACVTSQVTLQVIDRVLMPATDTIASILANNTDFSLFTTALRFARVFDFLDRDDGVSRTVFVPTNEAFSDQIPPDLFICLMYKRFLLSDIVLYHIAKGADYTTSLSLRQFTYTLQLQVINLRTDESGNVITFLTDPPSNIIVPNIPASNGVIHVIDGVLIPPQFDYRSCTEFVPTTPPPTTAPPPTTIPPDVTTPFLVTTSPDATTIPPDSTTIPPDISTPFLVTTSPDATTIPPDSTTIPPDSTTIPPDSTTIPPDSTTIPPDSTTIPPDSTTIPPDSTTNISSANGISPVTNLREQEMESSDLIDYNLNP